MMAVSTKDESTVFVRFQGDDWVWDWATADSVVTYSDPRVTIRETREATATVVASTELAVPTVTTTGTNFATGVLSWQVDAAITSAVAAGLYWLEVKVLIGTDVRTILSHSLRVLPQVAVPL